MFVRPDVDDGDVRTAFKREKLRAGNVCDAPCRHVFLSLASQVFPKARKYGHRKAK